MPRFAPLFHTLLLCAILLPADAFADRITLFGPARFDKPKGRPVTFSAPLTAPADAGSCVLRVTNGGDLGHEAKNVSVRHNGVELVDSGDLRLANPVLVPLPAPVAGTLEVVLKGQGGNFVTLEVFQERAALVVFDEPLPNATLVRPDVTVRGRAGLFGATEAAVVVNGLPARLAGEEFVVEHVPLAPGWNTLRAESFLASGPLAAEEIQVYYLDGGDYLALEADDDLLVAPAEAFLTLDGRFPGPAAATHLECSEAEAVVAEEEHFRVTFPAPGLKHCIASVTDALGRTFSDQLTLQVHAPAELTRLVERRWEGLRTAFASGDVESAAALVTQASRERFRTLFAALAPRLPQIAAGMEAPAFDHVLGRTAVGVVYKNEVHGGREYRVTHEIYLELDRDGLWRIARF